MINTDIVLPGDIPLPAPPASKLFELPSGLWLGFVGTVEASMPEGPLDIRVVVRTAAKRRISPRDVVLEICDALDEVEIPKRSLRRLESFISPATGTPALFIAVVVGPGPSGLEVHEVALTPRGNCTAVVSHPDPIIAYAPQEIQNRLHEDLAKATGAPSLDDAVADDCNAMITAAERLFMRVSPDGDYVILEPDKPGRRGEYAPSYPPERPGS
jgi:hypothetical protein